MRKLLTEADGRKLAVKMLREVSVYQIDDEDGPWPWSVQAMFRPEKMQQDNVLLRYLEKIQGNREALAGFCSIITDHLGQGGPGGGTLYERVYEKLTERDITGSPGPWPRMEDDDPPSAMLQ